MKKLFIGALMLIIVCCFASCKTPVEHIERFTLEAGRAAYIESEERAVPNTALKLNVPEGTEPYLVNIDAGVIIVSADSDEVDEEFNPIPAYGIADLNGILVADCVYDRIAVSGNFLMAEIDNGVELSDISYDFYYKDGTKLFNTENVINGFTAISDDYFVLYTEESSEVFYKDGSALFGTNRQLSSSYCYSVCGEYLFAQEPENAIYFIYRIFEASPMLVKSYVSNSSRIYISGYIGNGEFLVAETVIADNNDYDYWSYVGSLRYYYSQTVKIIRPDSDETVIDSDVIITGVINKHSPAIDYSVRKAYNLKEGYSAVTTIKTDNEKQNVGIECYVINNDAVTVLKMPEGLTPFMMTYKNNLGFAGNALNGYAAALFDYAGNAVWIKQDAEYYAQSYAYQRYIAAKSDGEALRYGMFDTNGNTIIDFNLDFLSGFSGDYALAKNEGSYYRVNKNGELIEAIGDIRDDNLQLTFNCYVYIDENKLGLKNFAGETLIAAEYDDLDYIGGSGGNTIVIFIKNNIKEAYRIGA